MIIEDYVIDLCEEKIIEEYHKEDLCMGELLASIKCINLSVEDNYELYKDLDDDLINNLVVKNINSSSSCGNGHSSSYLMILCEKVGE